jgi:hypothetical protein
MPIEWAIILVVAISDAILLTETSFRLEVSSQLRILADLIPLAILFVICRRWRSSAPLRERRKSLYAVNSINRTRSRTLAELYCGGIVMPRIADAPRTSAPSTTSKATL